MNNNFLKMFSIVLCFSMSGCASQVSLTPAQKSAIHEVSVSSQVKMPSGSSYCSSTQLAGFICGGLVGYAIVDAAQSGDRGHINSEIQNNHIAINSLLIQSVENKIASSPSYKLVNNRFGDVRFKLEINSYGFGAEGVSPGNIAIPQLSVDARLYDPQGKLLWKHEEQSSLNQSPYDGYTLQYYLDHPEVLKKAFQELADMIADSLIDDFNSGR